MSLGRCIPDMVRRGEIDQNRAKRMQDLFDELERYYARSMGPDAAAAEASEATLRQRARDAALKKRQTLLQINRQREALKELDRFQGKSRYAAVSALLDDDDRAAYRGGNIVTSAKRIEYGVHSQISEFVERHHVDLLGKPRHADDLDDVVRELHGTATGNDVAKRLGDAIREAVEQLRQRFNAAGGAIGRLKDYGLPHIHDALRVRSAGLERWLSDIIPLLNRDKMIDDRTGVAFSDDGLREALSEVFETIRTNGLTGDATSTFRGSGKFANRRSEHRFLQFQDGDAWLRYNQMYGAADNAFTAIMGHISGMSKDIAIMERLGPNPDATMRFLLDHVDKTEAQSGQVRVAAVQGKSGGRNRAENLWRYIKGETSVPVVPETAYGRAGMSFVHGLRNWNVASMLGSATLTAVSDVASGVMARRLYGLSDVQSLAHVLKSFNPRSASDRALARQIGAGMAHEARTMTGTARLFGESRGPAWTQQLADSSLRISGLNVWTAKGQDSFVVDFLGRVGDLRDRSWEDLPARMRTMMENNGLDHQDWHSIQLSRPIEVDGRSYIDPAAIRNRGAAERLGNMVLRGRAAAVIEASPTATIRASLGTRAGTIGGEAVRGSFQFKTFVLALTLKQYRMMAIMRPADRAKYAAQFFIGMTMFGAVAVQMRELAKGKDPRPMDTVEFWQDAALQSGGIGIVGDLFGLVTSERIDSLGQYVAGPVGSFAVDAIRAVKTALPKERNDGSMRPGNPGKAALTFAKRHTPGTSLWYMRAACERLVIDTLDERINQDSELDRARAARRVHDQGQDYWWEPGDLAPERTPSMANSVDGKR